MLRGHSVVPLRAPLSVRHMSRLGKVPIMLPAAAKITSEPYPVEELRPVKELSRQNVKYRLRHTPDQASFQQFGEPTRLRIDGPLGSLRVPIHSFCSVDTVDGALQVNVKCGGQTKLGKTLWGTTRSYIASAVHGVTQGFQKELELQGVGFKARVETFDIAAPRVRDPSPLLQGKKGAKVADIVRNRPLGSKKYPTRTGAQAGTLYVPPEGPPDESTERQALYLRVGFSHEVRLIFPPYLTVSTPTPTSVVIFGIDQAQVGNAAQRVKQIRKPDVYKGKGIRYEGEVIKLRPGKRR